MIAFKETIIERIRCKKNQTTSAIIPIFTFARYSCRAVSPVYPERKRMGKSGK